MQNLSYVRAIELLINTIEYALTDRLVNEAKDDLEFIGFTDEELCALGYKDIFFEEEE